MQHSNILCLGILFTVITQLIHLAIINDGCKCSVIWSHSLSMVGGGTLSSGHTRALPFLLGLHLLALLNPINLIRIIFSQ